MTPQEQVRFTKSSSRYLWYLSKCLGCIRAKHICNYECNRPQLLAIGGRWDLNIHTTAQHIPSARCNSVPCSHDCQASRIPISQPLSGLYTERMQRATAIRETPTSFWREGLTARTCKPSGRKGNAWKGIDMIATCPPARRRAHIDHKHLRNCYCSQNLLLQYLGFRLHHQRARNI